MFLSGVGVLSGAMGEVADPIRMLLVRAEIASLPAVRLFIGGSHVAAC